MTFQLYVVFGDHRNLAEEHSGIATACRAALGLADDLGKRLVEDERRPPLNVDVYDAAHLEISIRILRGGLARGNGAPTAIEGHGVTDQPR